ncbi:MAG: hypothetical protein ACYC1Z_13570, partial [Georgenia sp.]
QARSSALDDEFRQSQIAAQQQKPTRRAVGTEKVLGPDGKPRLATRYADGGFELSDMQPYEKPDAPRAPILGTPEYLKAQEEVERMRARYRPPPSPSAPNFQILPTGDGYVAVNPKTLDTKPVQAPGGQGRLQPRQSSGISEKVIANQKAMSAVDDAIAKLGSHPKAVGLGRGIWDFADQRLDPEGVQARASLADVGSLQLHDRSGAAVTASEWPRLAPFIPRSSDTPQAAMQKLKRLRAMIAIETRVLAKAPSASTPGAGTSTDGGPNLERF